MSKGKIEKINKYEFIHTASTSSGSTGSPIILKYKGSVIGIYKEGNDIKKENYGDFIWPIINLINTINKDNNVNDNIVHIFQLLKGMQV